MAANPRESTAKRTEENPVRRKIERLDALLEDVARDAEERAESYPTETLVPEGGE